MSDSFSAELWQGVTGVYDAILAHPFLTGLTDGSLRHDAFAFYVEQDAIYLHGYAQALAAVASRAPTPSQTEMFARHAADAIAVEKTLHGSLRVDVLGHGLPQGSLARLIRGAFAGISLRWVLRGAAGRVRPGPLAPRPGRSRRGPGAVNSRRSCGRRGSACRRVGPGLSACVGQNKTRSPPCMRCRGPRLGLAASGQPVAWPSRRGHAARQSQEPALGSGCPAPPTSRSRPRAVPVSNGESISTASARDGARGAPHFFPAFFLSTRCPQNMAGYPQLIVVFHRLLHRSSTGY